MFSTHEYVHKTNFNLQKPSQHAVNGTIKILLSLRAETLSPEGTAAEPPPLSTHNFMLLFDWIISKSQPVCKPSQYPSVYLASKSLVVFIIKMICFFLHLFTQTNSCTLNIQYRHCKTYMTASNVTGTGYITHREHTN